MNKNEKPPLIRLDNDEIEWATSVGTRRHRESEKRGFRQSDRSKDSNALLNHIRGAASELALSKFLDEPWQATVNAYNDFPDLNGYMECRSKIPGQQYLRIRAKDKDTKGDSIFVSVTRLDDNLREFQMDGWIIGRNGMLPENWKQHNYSKRMEWGVPLSALRPPSELKAELKIRLDLLREGREKLRLWMEKKLATVTGRH